VATPQELYDHPDNDFVAGFVGSPPMNLLRAELESTGDGLRVVLGAQHLEVPASYLSSHDLPNAEGPGVVLGIRPEDVEVLSGDVTGTLTTRVERREALGAEILVHLSLVEAKDTTTFVVNDEGSLVVRPSTLVAKMGPRAGVAVGDQLNVRFNVEHLHFFDATSGMSLRKRFQ